MDESTADPYASTATDVVDTGQLWQSSEGQLVNVGYFAVCLLLCWLVLPLVALLVRYLRTSLHVYELTPQRLRETAGLFSRRTDELELYRVKDVAIAEPFFQRLFGRGSVVLLTSDRSTPNVVLSCIENPRGVADAIRNLVEKCRVAKGVREIDQPR